MGVIENGGTSRQLLLHCSTSYIHAVVGNCSVFVPDATLPIPSMESSCIALPPVTHMDVGNAKAMLDATKVAVDLQAVDRRLAITRTQANAGHRFLPAAGTLSQYVRHQ